MLNKKIILLHKVELYYGRQSDPISILEAYVFNVAYKVRRSEVQFCNLAVHMNACR